MTLLNYIVVCCIIAGLLGFREAFRFRLMVSSAAMVTTGVSVVGVFSWLFLVISAFFVLSILQGIVVLVVPFVVGSVVRIIASRLSGGGGIISGEHTAKLEFENRLATKRTNERYEKLIKQLREK